MSNLIPDAAEMSAESRVIDDGVDIYHLSEKQLAQLGMTQIAYVKPVVVQGGQTGFAIFAADGTPMAIAGERDLAYAAILQHEMTAVAVH